jgi:hypothetical protein
MNKQHSSRIRRSVLVALLAAAWSSPGWAGSFELGDGWNGSWSSSISLGSSWRASDRDNRLYGKDNGALIGLTDGRGANAVDEGNLNYDKGDRYTTLLKVFSEVEIKKGDMGLLVRGKAWYDEALSRGDVRFGNQGNGYNGYQIATNTMGARQPLSDDGFERLNKFKGLYLLDAYVYNTFEVADLPLQVRAGNQVVNWGESLFIQGLNQVNPIDVPSFRKPGAQLKEVFLPVPILHASQSLSDYGSVEVFWQAQWKNTPVEAACGNYWAVALGNISTSPGSCNNAITLVQSNPFGVAANAYIPTIEGRKAKNSGEFGLAYRFNADKLDTEFGIYAMNIHSRLPIISLQRGSTTAAPFSIFWEYPEDMQLYGISAATNVMGWSMGAEISYTKDAPVQVDGNDLLFSGLGAIGAIPGLPAGTPFGPNGARAVAGFGGNGYVSGYTRANKSQFQINAVKAGNGILGAGQYLFIAEVGFQANNLPDYKKDPSATRYNRAFIFGPGAAAAYGGSTCDAGLNIAGTQGCDNDGYVSKNAWGYRMKAELTYNDLLPGIAVYPSVYWSHDVKGYSLDSQFLEGRQALALATRFSYAKQYTLELGAVRYNRSAKYDPLRDRDSFYLNAAMSF